MNTSSTSSHPTRPATRRRSTARGVRRLTGPVHAYILNHGEPERYEGFTTFNAGDPSTEEAGQGSPSDRRKTARRDHHDDSDARCRGGFLRGVNRILQHPSASAVRISRWPKAIYCRTPHRRLWTRFEVPQVPTPRQHDVRRRNRRAGRAGHDRPRSSREADALGERAGETREQRQPPRSRNTGLRVHAHHGYRTLPGCPMARSRRTPPTGPGPRCLRPTLLGENGRPELPLPLWLWEEVQEVLRTLTGQIVSLPSPTHTLSPYLTSINRSTAPTSSSSPLRVTGRASG